jgi:hypothetical protein
MGLLKLVSERTANLYPLQLSEASDAGRTIRAGHRPRYFYSMSRSALDAKVRKELRAG